MIVVDTSVWVDHLNVKDHPLQGLLESGHVLIHPLVIGELGCGQQRNRAEILKLLTLLPRSEVPSNDDVMAFISQHSLFGKGIGIVDAHILCATAATPESLLWTMDLRLKNLALALNLSFK